MNSFLIKVVLINLSLMNCAFAEGELLDPTKPAYLQNKSTITKTVLPPKSKATNTAQTWTLETTLADSTRILAIINGQQVRVGDEVDGAYVMKITHQEVTLKYDDKLFDIELHKSFMSSMK